MNDAVLLTPVLPARGGNGLAMRAGVTLEGLARSHRVRVVVAPVLGEPDHHDDELVDALAAEVRWLTLAPPDDPRAHAISLLSTPGGRERAATLHPLPGLCRTLIPAAAREIAAIVGDAGLVWTLRLYLAPLLDALLDATTGRPPIVLDLDDRDAAVHRALGAPEEAAAYARLEAYYLPRVDLVTTASAVDATAVGREHGLARAVGLPNAVRLPDDVGRTIPNTVPIPEDVRSTDADETALDPGGLPAEATAAETTYDLLFVGNLAYAPNVEAAHWIATVLRAELDAPRIAIAGSGPAPEVLALGELDGVDVLADVPDLAPLYARSAVALAPLVLGGGTRIKILEALAHGRPVVATSVGAEGLDLGADDGVLIAERDAGFATACTKLLDDPALARRLGAAGRRTVHDRASVERVAGEVDRLARTILPV